MSTSDIIVKQERRLCEVNGELGYFHCWENYSDVVAPSLMQGGHHGGQYSRMLGIVEFPDGMRRVEVTDIRFVDEEARDIIQINKMRNERKESNNGDVQREAD